MKDPVLFSDLLCACTEWCSRVVFRRQGASIGNGSFRYLMGNNWSRKGQRSNLFIIFSFDLIIVIQFSYNILTVIMVSRNIGKYVFVWYNIMQKVEKIFVCAKVNCERFIITTINMYISWTCKQSCHGKSWWRNKEKH